MAAAPDIQISVWRNTDDPPVVWQTLSDDGTPAPLAESYELNVYWPAQTADMRYGSDDVGASLTINRDTAEVTWAYSLDDSARIPLGTKATYELYGISGGRRSFWYGGTVQVGTFAQ